MKDTVLCFMITDRISVHISAALENGCLTVEGYDCGEAVEEFWGNDDYEYRLRFDKAGTDKLFRLLCKKDEPPEEALAEKFNGPDACSDLKRFCTEHGIEYDFQSRI